MIDGPSEALRDLDLPAMLLHDAPLRHNIRTMADYCRRAGVEIAPHAKTSMTSHIARLQLESGAWGQTAASVAQARHLLGMGVRRILLANVLVARREIDWVAQQFLQDDPTEPEILCYVDSEQGVEILEDQLGHQPTRRPLGVLVEVGFTGGRTGVRSASLALALARRVSSSTHLQLRGISGFEGLMPRDGTSVPPGLEAFLNSIRETVVLCHEASLFSARPVVSAGGSSYFDLVVQQLGPDRFDFDVTTVLRSGCYATHDHGVYHETSPLDGRAGPDVASRFQPALELVAHVWSRPEDGLVIAGFGRRDAPTDDRLPIVLGRVSESGSLVREPGAEVFGVNDQHAFIHVPERCSWKAGDVLSFGVSHPCGAFDRWRTLPVVDDERRIIGRVKPLL